MTSISVYDSITCIVMEVNGDPIILDPGEAMFIAEKLMHSARKIAITQVDALVYRLNNPQPPNPISPIDHK